MARRGLRPATAGGHRLWASRGWLASPAADRVSLEPGAAEITHPARRQRVVGRSPRM